MNMRIVKIKKIKSCDSPSLQTWNKIEAEKDDDDEEVARLPIY